MYKSLDVVSSRSARLLGANRSIAEVLLDSSMHRNTELFPCPPQTACMHMHNLCIAQRCTFRLLPESADMMVLQLQLTATRTNTILQIVSHLPAPAQHITIIVSRRYRGRNLAQIFYREISAVVFLILNKLKRALADFFCGCICSL